MEKIDTSTVFFYLFILLIIFSSIYLFFRYLREKEEKKKEEMEIEKFENYVENQMYGRKYKMNDEEVFEVVTNSLRIYK